MSIANTKEFIMRYPDDCWLPGISSEPGIGFTLNTSALKALAADHDRLEASHGKLLAAAKLMFKHLEKDCARMELTDDEGVMANLDIIRAAIEDAE